MLPAARQPLSLHLISLLKSLDPSPGVDYPLLACVKGVALTAYFYLDLRPNGTGEEGVTAQAGHLSAFIILGMNLSLHS